MGFKKIYGFDCENDGKSLTVGSIYGENTRFSFYSVDELKKELGKNKYRNCVLFATNLEYDLGVVFNNDKEFEKKTTRIRRGGRIISARYHSTDKNTITFSDTMNFTPNSVESLGKLIGIDKMKPPFHWRVDNLGQLEYLTRYNLQDSKITFMFMHYLRKSFKMIGSDLCITASSTALKVFKNKYFKKKFKHSKYITDEQLAYFGGRTEAFQRGYFEKVYIYDFVSMYPSAMKGLQIPKPETAIRCIDVNFRHEGISLVRVKCPDLLIPLLPFKTDKLLFPKGEFQGWYTHIELRKAREIGYEITVIKSITYETEEIFSDYVDDFFSMKNKYDKEENKIMKLIAKLFLNSLYGKFATKLEVELDVHVDELSQQRFIELLEKGNRISGEYMHYKEPMKYIPDYVMPIVSAYITSKSRVMLYEKFEEVGFENVLYCDTDSIFTTKKLSEGDNLGELNLEYDGRIIIVRPKCYCPLDEGKSIKVKGLGRVIKNENDFRKYIIEGETVYYKRLARIKESRRSGYYYGQEIECFKTICNEDNKREWNLKFCDKSSQTSEAKVL